MLIQIILISDDQNYSLAVLNDLSSMRRKFTVTEMGWGDNAAYDFEFALANGRYQTPTIVMLDFGFSLHCFDQVVERLEAIREIMAIECMVLRPPADDALIASLKARGLPIFTGVETPAMPAEAIH